MLVKVKDIFVDKSWNYRETYADIPDLMASIKSEGLKQSPLVAPYDKNGFKYVVTAGHRRMVAIQQLGWEDVEVTIDMATDDVSRRISSLIENVQRSNPSFGEEARALRILLEKGLVEQSIADRIGKSRSWVQERNYYNQMPEPFQKEFDKGKMTTKELRTAYTIFKIHGEAKLYEVVRKHKEAKEKGKTLDMQAIALGGARKAQRLIADQTAMQDHLIATVGLQHPMVKLLAWTLGAITDDDLDDYLSETEPTYTRRF
jgi:ParB/RepB/Spo0J family partition protein